MLDELSKSRDIAVADVTRFSNDLGDLILKRDINEEKLKSSHNLKIELPKFKGYESDMDIYTFRAEFEKLIEPVVQKKLWPDYLKRNYLSGNALTLVEKLENIDEIWKKLIGTFGNARLLLQNKISALEKQNALWRVSGDEKVGMTIASLLNIMLELKTLAEKFKLEEELYYGGCFEKILSLLGNSRERKFVSKCDDPNAKKPDEWARLVEFLKKELSMRERLTLLYKSKNCLGIAQKQPQKDQMKLNSANSANNVTELKNNSKCHICDKLGHVVTTSSTGRQDVPYYACKQFVEMTPSDRRKILFDKKLCAQCLEPGMRFDQKHNCPKTFVCPDNYHKKFQTGLHVLVCQSHRKNQDNLDLVEKFKKTVMDKISNLDEFSKSIGICYTKMAGNIFSLRDQNSANSESHGNTESDISNNGIFMLQTIKVNGQPLNLFFDSGCGDIVVKKSAIDYLQTLGRANLEVPGPIELTGVGDVRSTCSHGAYSIRLPLKNGREAVLSGLCLDKVTATFPTYKLDKVTRDLRDMCNKVGNELSMKCPKLPKSVGGDTDILIGIKYIKYFPELVHMFPSGLAVYQSVFLNSDGSDGVVAGPHPEFTKAENSNKGIHAGKPVYFCPLAEQYLNRCRIESEIPLLGNKPESVYSYVDIDQLESPVFDVCICRKELKALKGFERVENTATEITYRCIDCRNCPECKKGPRLESVSIQEEAEQALIDRSVSVDLDKRVTTARLPFIVQPDNKLVPNKNDALRIYKGQVRQLAKRPEDKHAVIESENKLQQLGYVDFYENLSEEERTLIDGKLQNYIPWRVVWNENSTSTSCRLVFDGSHTPKGGCSLNSLLAKGINGMNKLIDILIRWTIYKFAFHTDIQKMYNSIVLLNIYWRYQMYLWSNDLDVERPPHRKVIKTLIYGVTPSGNLAERGLRLTAEKTKHLYPCACDIILNDLYVDDGLSGCHSYEDVLSTTDELKLALEKGGFTLKGFTISGCDPPGNLSKDGESVLVGGLKWFPKGDFISINCKDINFAKKNRGRKLSNMQGVIPEHLTMRDCVGKVAEIFDPLGRVCPLVSGMKLDIHELHMRKLDWDHKIPDELRKVWVSNFELIQEIGNVKFNRAIVPIDAENLNIETIDTGDASKNLICSAIYARFKRKSGEFSCQLIFARSKIVSEEISVPRKELMAATLNASTGHAVKTALGDMHKRYWKLTDSQVALYWISSSKSNLKLWVRNRVVEINRLADAKLWRYVESKGMCADLGTRRGAKLADISPHSEWIIGCKWMRGSEADFPIKTVPELALNAAVLQDAQKESIVFDQCNDHPFDVSAGYFTRSAVRDYKTRYSFSNYLIDPLKFRFRKVVRILGLVFLFISKCRKPKTQFDSSKDLCRIKRNVPESFQNRGDQYVVTTGSIKFQNDLKCVGGLVVQITNEMIAVALRYFHLRATAEILEFLDERRYRKISVRKDGILYYSGRILSTQEFGGDPSLCKAALDLTESSFCVPLTDNGSPIARAIVDEIHWHHDDVKHRGVESVLRQVQRNFYVIGGRGLVKSFKRECKRCKLLEKKAIKVAMGPLKNENLCIAPAFYNSQVDICGPFNAYSNANKRATLKIWFVVYCCCTTGATACLVMEDYSADAFVLAFIRFSCRYGYPKQLLPDEGSQLVKGCKNMVISFTSLQHKLSVEHGVDFNVCPVGAHYMHGKVERKIQQIKKSMARVLDNRRLSIMQWETLGIQISNSINNLPLGLGSKTDQLENLDILTPNRLLLGKNNDRCPAEPLKLSNDLKRIIETNANIFRAWFNSWLISYVPTLIEQPKWFENDGEIFVGDVVLFLKCEQEFDQRYQYGIVRTANKGRDGQVRSIEIEYQNHNEKVKRYTIRGARDVVVIHQVNELPSYDK